MSNKNDQQTFQFDKFMEDFEEKDRQKKEDVNNRASLNEENPNLEYFKRHQEDWRNSTYWSE